MFIDAAWSSVLGLIQITATKHRQCGVCICVLLGFSGLISSASHAVNVETTIAARVKYIEGPQVPAQLQVGDSVSFTYRYDDSGVESHDYYLDGRDNPVSTVPISIYPHLTVLSDTSATYSENISVTLSEYTGSSGYSYMRSSVYWLEDRGVRCFSDKVPPSAMIYLCWLPGDSRPGTGRITLWGRDPLDGHNIWGATITVEYTSITTSEVIPDDDFDGVLNDSDNCKTVRNPDQIDTDGDAEGNDCDADDDNDLVPDGEDNCPLAANADQSDADADSAGDACDGFIDNDADGIPNDLDNCPVQPNEDQSNIDLDLAGDLCDADDDNDSVDDAFDNCSLVQNIDQADHDADGIGDLCDADDDNDGVADDHDNCSVLANAGQEDTDSDSLGDACDADDDSDTVLDEDDNCPISYNPMQENSDAQGAGDVCNSQNDSDDDDWENGWDNCPLIPNQNQSDGDGDGSGDACDPDADNDAVANEMDACPRTPAGSLVSGSGCSIVQLCPCDAPRQSAQPWRNHGQYVSCVSKATQNFWEDGLFGNRMRQQLLDESARSTCGR